MRVLLLICAGVLLLGVANLPIGYYTLLRIIVTIGSVSVIVTEFRKGLNFWNIAFGLIAIVFNPIIPIYLNDKSVWMFIDIFSGIIFIVKSFTLKQKKV